MAVCISPTCRASGHRSLYPWEPQPHRHSVRRGSERQQYVPRHAGLARVAGVYEYHPLYNYRTWTIDRPAVAFDAVDGLKFTGGVEVPQDLAVFGRISAQMAVDGTG